MNVPLTNARGKQHCDQVQIWPNLYSWVSPETPHLPPLYLGTAHLDSVPCDDHSTSRNSPRFFPAKDGWGRLQGPPPWFLFQPSFQELSPSIIWNFLIPHRTPPLEGKPNYLSCLFRWSTTLTSVLILAVGTWKKHGLWLTSGGFWAK